MLRWGHSLRAKIILILAGVVVVYAGLDALVQRLIIYPSFERLEEQGGFTRPGAGPRGLYQ